MKHKRRRKDETDRFSNLPKEIVHHILSRLVIRDLCRFCCVSTTCKELALSTPSVSIVGFDGFNGGIDLDEMPCELRMKLVNALDRFLFSRGDNKMQKFSLHWRGHCEDEMDDPCFCVNESFRMITWIKNAVRCNVEKLSVDMTFYEPDVELLPFPCSVFSCASLRYLKLEMTFAFVKTPSLSVSSNLETLDLNDVDITDEGFFKWISCSCKLLKKLTLARVNGIDNINIESSSLEHFFYIHYDVFQDSHIHISGEKIEELTIDCRYSPRSTVVNIIAPKVRILMLEGNVKSNLNLGNLDNLKEASICMEPIVDEFDKVVLSSLCSVGVLILNEATIKAAYREEGMQAQLDKIWCLRINIGSFADDLVPAVVALLRGMPNLCILYICYEPTSLDPKSNTSGFDKNYWKKQNLDFISQVEEVTIELSAGSNGIEFARYVLRHAKSLEKMVIRYLNSESSVKRKLRKSDMMSNAAVTYVKYKAVDPLV